MPKKWKYPKSIKVIDKDGKVKYNIITQLYSIGVYVAIYTSYRTIPHQLNHKPEKLQKVFKRMIEHETSLGNTVELGSDIIVSTDDNGFYIDVT